MTTKPWTTLIDLALMLQDRGTMGRKAVLSAQTAKLIGDALLSVPPDAPRPPGPDARFHVDMFAKGSAIYRLDVCDDPLDIVAWVNNAAVARATYDGLLKEYPTDRFMQKRGAWVEREPPPRG